MSKKIFFSIVFSLLAVILGASFLCIDFNKIEKAEQTTADDPIIDPDGYWIDVYDDFETYSFVGSGTETDPYLIQSAKDLAFLSWTVYNDKAFDNKVGTSGSNKYYYSGNYFKQTADIDLSACYWQPIGMVYDRTGNQKIRCFAGNYDGDNYEINGLHTPSGSSIVYSYQGLFGLVGIGSLTFKNIKLVDVNILGYQSVGGIVGGNSYFNNNITFINCSVSGELRANNAVNIGGLIGSSGATSSYKTIVKNCQNYANITVDINSSLSGNLNIGGLVSYAYYLSLYDSFNAGNITLNVNTSSNFSNKVYVGGVFSIGGNSVNVYNCYNIGEINLVSSRNNSELYIGGIGGILRDNSLNKIYNSINKGTINVETMSSSSYTGGIVGLVDDTKSTSSRVELKNCYNLGSINSKYNVGGIAGSNNLGTIQNCYYGGDCSVGGINGSDVVGQAERKENLTVNDFKNQDFYLNVDNWDSSYPWDFDNTWVINSEINEGYPSLIEESVKTPYWIEVYNDFDSYSFVGAGTKASPYLISSEKDLAYLSWTVYYNKKTYNNSTYFKQTVDLDISEYLWQPIGIYYNRDGVQVTRGFKGNYNGDSYSISGLQTPTGSSNAESYQGLFGYLDNSSSIIENVNLVNVDINGNQYVGGIAGQSTAKIYNCSVSGIINGNQYIGGIAGFGYVFESYNNANISSNGQYIGGIVGRGYAVTSYNTGNLTGNGSYVGGIVGYANTGVTTNCFNVGDITGDTKLGGIAGYLSSAVISDCYSISLIVGNSEIGGVVGNVASTSEVVNNCYYGGNYDIGGINGENVAGEAEKKDDLTVENFKSENFYLNNENWSAYSWDFENVWEFNSLESEYPTFKVVEDKQYWTDVYSDFDVYTLSGGGTETNPYLIQNAKDLTFLSWTIYNDKAYKNKVSTRNSIKYYYSNVYFKQTADIDLSGYYWQPIGISSLRDGTSANRIFSGNYDGGNFAISGLSTPSGYTNAFSYQGLFGRVGYYNTTNKIVIKNINLTNSAIYGSQYVGALIGYLDYSYSTYCTIKDCINEATVKGYGYYVGGLIGHVSNSKSGNTLNIEQCINYGCVSGNGYIGGIIGSVYAYSYSLNINLSNCVNWGKISSSYTYLGGVLGCIRERYPTLKMYNCYNSADLIGTSYVAGVIGYGYFSTNSEIFNCFNVAKVCGSSYVAGIIAYARLYSNSSQINLGYCYNVGEINGKTSIGAILGNVNDSLKVENNYYGGNCKVGGINNVDVEGQAEKKEDLSINNFKDISFYEDENNWANGVIWDFDYFWGIESERNNGLPYLRLGDEKPLFWIEANIDFANYVLEGSGTETEPYLIQSAEDLAFLSWSVYYNKAYNGKVSSMSDHYRYYEGVFFKQTQDIDLSEYFWQPIGFYVKRDGIGKAARFCGSYNGNNFSISGIKTPAAYNDNYNYQGLFGYVYQPSSDKPVVLDNIKISDSSIKGNKYVGAIVGYKYSGTIKNCENHSDVSGYQYVGGIVGSGSSSDCLNTANIYGSSYVGGITGNGGSSNSYNTGNIKGGNYVGGISGSGSINNSYNIGLIEGDQYVGGVVGIGSAQVSYNLGEVYGAQYVGGISGGYGSSSGGFYNNFNVGNVYGEDSVGGIIGYLNYSTTKVNNCYNLGAVNGTTYVGGIVGQNTSTQISKCYYGVNCSVGGINGEDVSGQAQADASLTLDNFKTTSFYTDMTKWDVSCPWDFYYIWKIDSNYNVGFPILREENDVGIEFWTDVYTDFDSYSLEGSGSSTNPYLIQSEKDLVFISWTILNDKSYNNHVYQTNYYYRNIYFKQTKDLDFTGYYWKPIGLYYDTNGDVIERAFSGNYDGAGYSISGIETPFGNTNRYSCQGLFGYVSSRGSSYCGVQNLTIKNSNINGYENVGGLIGYLNISLEKVNSTEKITISNVHTDVDIYGLKYVGGIIGKVNLYKYDYRYSYTLTVEDVYNTGNISGSSYVGGIVGYAYLYCYSTSADIYFTLTNSYNSGNIEATSSCVGGNVGYIYTYSRMSSHDSVANIINCFNVGKVSGSSTVGGIVGYTTQGSYGKINLKNNFNTASVSANSSVGGILGTTFAQVLNCYYGGDCSVGGINGQDVEGQAQLLENLNSNNFKSLDFFNNISNWSLSYIWDFDTNWTFMENENNGYPVFKNGNVDEIVYWIDVYDDFGTYSLSGSGSREDPYLIQSAKDLAFLSWTVYNDQAYNNNVTISGSSRYFYESKYFKQTAEIDLSQYYWQPIGVYYNREGSSVYRYFSGNYDGQNYAISGLKTPYGTTNAYSHQGLFGYVRRYSTIEKIILQNITLNSTSVKGNSSVGGVVAYIYYGDIVNCKNNSGYVLGTQHVGGIVGYTQKVELTNNFNLASVGGTKNVGGINGYVYDSLGAYENENKGAIISNQYVGGIFGYVNTSSGTKELYFNNLNNLGSVKGESGYVGGIIGCSYTSSTSINTVEFSNFSNTGKILNYADYTGGLVGYIGDSQPSSFIIENSSNSSNVSGGDIYTGGIVGYSKFSIVLKNNTNDGDITGANYLGGIIGYSVGGALSYSSNNGIIKGKTYVGGLVGAGLTISSSFNLGEVNGNSYVGGICYSGTIKNSFNQGNIIVSPTGSNTYAGGISSSSSSMSNCYNLGNIELKNSSYNCYVGGLTGSLGSSAYVKNSFNIGNINIASTSSSNPIGGVVGQSYGEINNCYNLGQVSGTGKIGGILGESLSGCSVSNCFYGVNCTTKGINGQDVVGQAEYDESLTIDNFKDKAFYLDSSNWDSSYPWNFEFYWDISSETNNGYPYLKDESALPKYWTEVYDDFDSYALSGSGTKSNPYKISSAKDLAFLSWTIYYNKPYKNNVYSSAWFYREKYFIQTADIDLSENYWQPIGIVATREGVRDSRYFAGNYDGNGYSISGLKTLYGTTNGDSYQGLFGYVYSYSTSYPSEIKNVKLVNTDVKGNSYVGGVIGYSASSYTTILNCSVDGNITGLSNVGGIIGSGSADISNCINNAEVMGETNIGGIVGRPLNSEILNSYNFALLNGSSNVGGIVGIISTSLTLENCFNYALITGENNTGGIVGKINITSSSTSTVNVTAVYNLGNVTGTSGIGGIIGQCDNSYTGTTINLTSSGVECVINGVNNSGVFIGESIGSAKVNLFNCYGIVKTNTSINSVGVTSTNLIISNCVYINNLQDGTLNKNYIGDDFTAFAWLNYDSCPIPKDLIWSGDFQQKPEGYETSIDWILDMMKSTGWNKVSI